LSSPLLAFNFLAFCFAKAFSSAAIYAVDLRIVYDPIDAVDLRSFAIDLRIVCDRFTDRLRSIYTVDLRSFAINLRSAIVSDQFTERL
jgi:hypothetical protein